MHIGSTVDWETDVLAAWKKAANPEKAPNNDVWERLPEGMCWFNCLIEPSDIEKIYVIGSYDWKEVFGTYCLSGVAANSCDADDRFRHKSKIMAIRNAIAVGKSVDPIILTAFSGSGPFVIIEGNHRAAAMMQLGVLAGQRVYVGFHQKIGSDFLWFRRAVLGED